MKILFAFVVLTLALTCAAQTAVVVPLNGDDATAAKTLYDAKQKADAAWEAFQVRVGKSYKLSTFEFSKDFRFIVPKTYGGGSGVYTFCSSPCWPDSTTSVPVTTAPYITPYTGTFRTQ